MTKDPGWKTGFWCRLTNAFVWSGLGRRVAITYREAAERYGLPVLVKMDIEGHEEAFLRCAEFKQWLISHRIALVVELHRPEYVDLLWPDVKVTRLHERIALIEPL